MEVFFRNILEISIMASFLILAVLLIRLCFRKASATFRCFLWMLVGVRLLVPISISSPFGLVPNVDISVEQELSQEGERQEGEVLPSFGDGEEDSALGAEGFGQTTGGLTGNMAGSVSSMPAEEERQQTAGNVQVPGTDVGAGTAYISSGGQEGFDAVAGIVPGVETNGQQGKIYGNGFTPGTDVETKIPDVLDTDTINQDGLTDERSIGWKTATVIWIVGSCLMILYMLVSFLRLRKSLREALPSYVTCGQEPVKVYRHESVDSPFLFGVLSPKIYVPMKLAGKDLQYVLAHERMHLRRRDHLLKPMSFIVLALYWFHPLVWVAYILLGRDIELACDERVLRENPKLDRVAYAEALLDCAVKQRKIAVCPVAFGEADVKQRVINVLNYKKPGFWIVLIGALLGVIVVLCFMTVSREKESLPTGTEDVQEGEAPKADKEQENVEGNESSGEKNSEENNVQPAVGEQLPTQERLVKYQIYYDAIYEFPDIDGDGVYPWDFVTSEFIYERSRWFADYNGEKLQRIASEDEQYMASMIPDTVYYRADTGEKPEEFVIKMLDAMIEPLMIPSENRSYTIKKYDIREQELIQIGDGIWLLPGIRGYYDYEGTDLITMEDYVKYTERLMWNGLMPFVAEGSSSMFYYLLVEEDGVFRLQRVDEMARWSGYYDSETVSEPENELIFYYPVNAMNAPGYIPPNEHELIAPDCFWAGSGKVFIDDTANDRILVYQNGLYEKTIALPWEMDVQKMYYLPETDELKVVFHDRNKTGSDYYLIGIDVSSGMLLDAGAWDEEIGNVHEIMAEYCFDSEGVLWRDMHYDKVQEPDEATKQANHIVTLGGAGEFPYTVTEEMQASASYLSENWEIVAKHNETNYYLYSRYVSGEEGRLSAEVVMKNDTHVATPEVDWNSSPILSLGPAGNLYQMVVDEGGVRIYRLGFAEFDAEDRNDMTVRQIETADVTVRSEGAKTMSPCEKFKVIDMNQVWEWTKDGSFAEMVQAQGMSLFEQYDNLEPSVLYKGATGASYSCKLDYDGKTYELTIMYVIDKERQDVKTVQRVYVQAVENSRKVVLYSMDKSEAIGDFGEFLISSYGVEKQISFILPQGFWLGAYNRQFSNYYASFLVGDIEKKPGDDYASDWAITPGGIGTFDGDYLAYNEAGEATGFAHWWTGTGGTWREENCEKLEGCFTSAILTEYHMQYFKTAPDHEAFMQKYPELADQYLEPVDYWYVYISDATMEKGYVVFLNQEYFTKEDVIALARSVKPLKSVDSPLERAYSLNRHIIYQLPSGYNFTLGDFKIPDDEVGPMYNGCLLEGDLSPLVSDGTGGEWAAAPGGIGIFTNWKQVTFENGEPVAISYGGNHRGVNKDSFEKVEGCFTSALLAELNFDLFTAATYEKYKQEHPELAASLQSTSKLWYVLICDESMDVGYVVFLNQEYFTKEDVITFARSVRPMNDK